MPVFRGEIYFVELGPVRGHELNDKRRPAVVLSVNEINRNGWVITVVPGKSYKDGKRVHSNQVKIEPSPQNGLKNTTPFECTQIKALDYRRFDQGPAGHISATQLAEMEESIKLCLGIP